MTKQASSLTTSFLDTYGLSTASLGCVVNELVPVRILRVLLSGLLLCGMRLKVTSKGQGCVVV